MNDQLAAFRTLTAVLTLFVATLAWADEEPVKPSPEGASTEAPEAPGPKSEVVVRVGNESNQNDGNFGPLTYGLRGAHTFASGMAIEAGYMRLHEPKTPLSHFAVDEAQLTFKLPKMDVLEQPMVLGATAWKNRMIDMYTNVGGMEFTRVGDQSIMIGIYGGTATRDDLTHNFVGGQAGVSGTLGPVELSASQMIGSIRSNHGKGFYRKTAVEAATNLPLINKLPLQLTFSVEDRHFDFGNNEAKSDPSDALIFVTGLEVHLEEIL